MAIRFFSDGTSFQPKAKRKLTQWLKKVAVREGKITGRLGYVFVPDEVILNLNKQYLQHDHYTDIITFDDSSGNIISGEMYISVDTVKANAEEYQVDFSNELQRVMVHGLLHLCGYKDHTAEEQKEMRAKEDKYLVLYMA